MRTTVDLIGGVPLFERLDTDLLTRLDAITTVITVAPDAVLSQQGAMPDALHVLLDGQVALSSTAADGTTALIEVLDPIDHFVLASVLSRLPYLMTARAVTRHGCWRSMPPVCSIWSSTRSSWPIRCCARCRGSSAPWSARCAT